VALQHLFQFLLMAEAVDTATTVALMFAAEAVAEHLALVLDRVLGLRVDLPQSLADNLEPQLLGLTHTLELMVEAQQLLVRVDLLLTLAGRVLLVQLQVQSREALCMVEVEVADLWLALLLFLLFPQHMEEQVARQLLTALEMQEQRPVAAVVVVLLYLLAMALVVNFVFGGLCNESLHH
jgi:hypothetical protein